MGRRPGSRFRDLEYTYDASGYDYDRLRRLCNLSAFSRSRFTGKERDSESGNDYFDARYYSSAMGRFMSPDWSAKEDPVPYANLEDPQSLNLYSYVRNNPLDRTDPDGHCCDLADVGNFVAGMTNAWKSDNVMGIGREQQDTAAGQVGGGWPRSD